MANQKKKNKKNTNHNPIGTPEPDYQYESLQLTEFLDHVKRQLSAYSDTLEIIQSQFAAQRSGENIISVFITLRHGINNINASVHEKLCEFLHDDLKD